MSNKSFQVIVALFDTWHQHKRNFYIETTLKNNMYCKYSHCSMKQTFMKICLIENCQNIKVHDQKTALFNLAKICFYWLAVDVSGGHFNNWEMQSMSFGTTSFDLYTSEEKQFEITLIRRTQAIQKMTNCVTRAPLLYFIRSRGALSFKVCESVRKAYVTPVQISTLCNI